MKLQRCVSEKWLTGQVRQQQHRVLQTLDVKHIDYEARDIAVDQEAKRDYRRLMRIHDARAATPQIFNRDTWCGVGQRFSNFLTMDPYSPRA